ncbi:MAG: hypothetical protein J1F68_06280, partial [Clostridiales bacterium]|nr:hypothetical protein [Clostridiales bacterium]
NMSIQFTSVDEFLAALPDINVHDLRKIARSVGMYPKERKRDDLIKIIVGRLKGELDEEIPVKPGRPPKDSSKLSRPNIEVDIKE